MQPSLAKHWAAQPDTEGADPSVMSSQLVGLRVPFCWQIAPSGGGQTGWAPSTQVGVEVHWTADVVEGVILGGRQTVGVSLTVTVDAVHEGALVTVTVDAAQVLVAMVEVAHVLEGDCAEVQVLVVLADVVADDLAGVLCEVVLPDDVDDAVVLGTLTVVLQYVRPSTRHSFCVNVALPLVSPQCRCYNTVSIQSIKVAMYTYHPCAIILSSQLDRLDNTLHKVLPLGQLEMEGTFWVLSKAVQNATAGANPERER